MNLEEVEEKNYEDLSKSDLQTRLARLSRICQNLEIPIMVMVDGFESSGKGYVINTLTSELNPKYFDVEVFEKDDFLDEKFPFAKRFFENVPKKGHIKIFDRSIYYKLFDNPDIGDKELDRKVSSLEKMEKMLYDDQTIIVKIFLNVSKKEQKKRIDNLKDSKQRSFYLSQSDKNQNENYKEYKSHFEKILEASSFKFSPWNIINSDDLKAASKEALYVMLEAITIGIERISAQRLDNKNVERSYDKAVNIIENLDLTKTISDEDYKEKKEKLQEEVRDLLFEFYNRGISTVLVFEGVDAAGKDGAIERLIKKVDPRLYSVHAISAPSKEEADRHYLWRFYTKLPEDGYIGIFSRSWYGRVMVERVEGFAKVNEWNRAYDEILEMEKGLYNHGSLVLKFFVTIDRDEQLERFKARENEPDKKYKITDEDWRNRDKWSSYIRAMDEMLDRTNVDYAPWIIVEGNQKKYARIKIMEEFIKHAKEHLKLYEDKNK
ncbi:MAG: hypothetical protein SPI59_06995 [Finegoldia sp.]|nr:hypothetical protein [Finegoldia sp.]